MFSVFMNLSNVDLSLSFFSNFVVILFVDDIVVVGNWKVMICFVLWSIIMKLRLE